jgi:hypothetical protein
VRSEGVSAMPMKLVTTIGKVQGIPNPKNIEIVNKFLDYMRRMVHQNITKIIILKVVIGVSVTLRYRDNIKRE